MREKRTAYNRVRMSDKGKRAALNARLKQRRDEDPAYAERSREATRRWRERKRQDPEWMEERRERARIDHRLKRESEGVALEDVRQVASVSRRGVSDFVPAAPLLMLVERLIEHRKVVAEVLNDRGTGYVGEVCQDLGLDGRKLRAWRNGEFERASIGMAERIMLVAGVEASEVYSRDDYPEVLALFVGVEEEASA